MVVAVNYNVKLNSSGLKEVLKTINCFKNTVAHSGVLTSDEKTQKVARLNVFGGTSHYDRGPYMGEEVEVPPRDFIWSPIESGAKNGVFDECFEGKTFDEKGVASISKALGEKMASEQRRALDTNGENVENWQKWQDFRTIETKGHDKPLHTWDMVTFPIDYEVVRKGA